ncbi:hypothetical protein VP01_423g2 [Puccinia sorghi]|uniref:Uncharacterized protein n=1 Tax=Puccinia sorghi TaxID=27349 RepID=A0A0L6UQH0_9BASI|nr:hypothetical protein VP01_423g2 [Puccinia sorghi]
MFEALEISMTQRGEMIPILEPLKARSITYSSTEAELNPLVESFHEGVWLKALINEMWRLQIEAAEHYIDDIDLNKQLTSDDETFKKLFCTNHLIDNKGLNDKLKKFGSNSKTRHIDLRTKGIRQEIKQNKIKITLIKTHEMLADALTKPTSIEPLKNLIKTTRGVLESHRTFTHLSPNNLLLELSVGYGDIESSEQQPLQSNCTDLSQHLNHFNSFFPLRSHSSLYFFFCSFFLSLLFFSAPQTSRLILSYLLVPVCSSWF